MAMRQEGQPSGARGPLWVGNQRKVTPPSLIMPECGHGRFMRPASRQVRPPSLLR